MQNTDNTIFFNFSYFALRLLGKGMYSNHWSAISELVANGLDAKANSVKIFIDMSTKKESIIEIIDNGTGMNYSDLSEKYALIGRDKREDSDLSYEDKEKIMGRKGVGKLAALYLSSKYYVVSKTTDSDESAWCLDATEVKDSDIPRLDRCGLDDVGIRCIDVWKNNKTGTIIHLEKVDLTNFGIKTLAGLKARLADFYLTDSLGSKIEVCVIENENQSIIFETIEKSIAYKNFYAFFDNSGLNYTKRLGSGVRFITPEPQVNNKSWPVEIIDPSLFVLSGKKQFVRPDGSLTEEIPYELKGWIGIHSSIKKEDAQINDEEYLKNKAYRPNQLRLYVRKKLAVENFLEYIKNTQALANYIEGEICFDILDNNELGDIATSNRQGFVEDDERVILLIELLKPIINYLIRLRVKVGNQVNAEVAKIHEEREKAEKEKAALAEKRQREAEILQKQAEKESIVQRERADILNENLKSEKRRNYFLNDVVGEKQEDFSKRLHMVKINSALLQKAIANAVIKIQRGKFSEKEAINWIKKMSYYASRIQAVLQYSAVANFDTQTEYVEGDLFEFIEEYVNELIKQQDDLSLFTEIENNEQWIVRFIPQNIVIIIDNVISNSIKNKASKLIVRMYRENHQYIVDFSDDGRGISKNVIDINEIFEFGKGFTDSGTGVGLYHIKEIVKKDFGGEVEAISAPNKGFTLRVKVGKK